MILSTARKYVFVHIPKTGGTSLALALEERAAKDDILIGDTPKARKRRHRVKGIPTRGRLWKHATLSDIEGLVPRATLNGLFAFTLVRNPWDRMVSYYFWLREQTFDHSAVRLAQELEFSDFILNPQTRLTFRRSPAASYMHHADGTEQCQAYIRLEQFARDAAPLWDHLGFELDLPRANRSARDEDFRAYYNDSTRRAVADFCAEDIRRFGYSFDD